MENNEDDDNPPVGSFFRLDPTYRRKDYDTSDKLLPLSQPLYATDVNEELQQTLSDPSGIFGNNNNNNNRNNVKQMYPCQLCKRDFTTKSGRSNHLNYCQTKLTSTSTATREDNALQASAHETIKCVNNSETLNAIWGNLSINDLEQTVSCIYEECMRWRRNLFLLPTGKSGKKFIEECTRLINAWNDKNILCSIAIKAFMVLPQLLLQKPSKTSKTKDHVNCLERRLVLWEKGDFDSLVRESRTIQKSLTSGTNTTTTSSLAKQFSNLMLHGKVNPALRLLSNEGNQGVLPLTDENLQALLSKHPVGRPKHEEMLLQGPIDLVDRASFFDFTGDSIQKAALRTKGAAGPSNLDAEGWRRILVSKSFGNSNTDLCKALARMATALCIEEKCFEGRSIDALLACRLIPLDKSPGVRPIGIGECIRRIIGKAVMSVIKFDVMEVAGNLQLCAGQTSGCEAAVHSMREIFEDPECDAVLLVDATNAFNCLNRNVMLHNIKIICPVISIFVNNCYQTHIRLFIVGGKEIYSQEGTTQGDPSSMAIYALGILPLITGISTEGVKHVAFADDLSGAGKLDRLRQWWQKVNQIGPYLGYFPNASKSWLILKPGKMNQAQTIFEDSGINITLDGKRHLGAAIGSQNFKEKFVRQKVDDWVREIVLLAKIAETEPQAAYAAFISGYRHKFNYFIRTLTNITDLLKPVENAVRYHLIKSLCEGRLCNDFERKLLALPIKLGGLGIINIVDLAEQEFRYSKSVTESLTTAIVNQETIICSDHHKLSQKAKANIKQQRTKHDKLRLEKLQQEMNSEQKKLNEIAQSVGASSWLSTLPIKDDHYDLNKREFHDAIYLRYGWEMKHLPINCVCQQRFTIQHALSCKVGGFISLRHNELRDDISSLLQEVCKDVKLEPQLQNLTADSIQDLPASSITTDESRADISASGFWQRWLRTFFDVRVFNPIAPSYQKQSLQASFISQEKEKKRKYNKRVLNVEHGSFTPLIFSIVGGMSRETSTFYSKLAELISEKRRCEKSETVTWLRRRISFSLVRSSIMCIRGTRNTKAREKSTEDMEITNETARIHI